MSSLDDGDLRPSTASTSAAPQGSAAQSWGWGEGGEVQPKHGGAWGRPDTGDKGSSSGSTTVGSPDPHSRTHTAGRGDNAWEPEDDAVFEGAEDHFSDFSGDALCPSSGHPRQQSQPQEVSAEDSLRESSNVLHTARRIIEANDRVIDSIKGSSGPGVQYLLRSKIEATTDVARALEERIESLEDSCRQTGECLFQLKRAYRSKWSALNICERRLQLRDQRPLKELFHDHLQMTLERERTTLLESRQELEEHVQQSMAMLTSLEGAKNALVEDLHAQRQVVRANRSALVSRPGSDSGRTQLPSLGSEGSSPKHHQSTEKDCRANMARAINLQENAIRLCNANDAAMLTTKQECSRASAATTQAVGQQVLEVEAVKVRLEANLEETAQTLEALERSILTMRRQVEMQEGPLKWLDKQHGGLHKHDAGGDEGDEGDQIGNEVEKHRGKVKRNVSKINSQYTSTKELIDRLRSSRKKMLEELRLKVQVLKIENACGKLTSRKAIELDRRDPCSGRCLTQRQSSRSQQRSGYR